MTASIIYNGALRCQAVHNQSETSIESDAPTDNKGKGERFSPTDLTCTSLGLCLITTMAIKATDMNIELEGASVDVQKYMSKEPPRRIVKVEVDVKLPAINISDRDRTVLEAAGNACPVAKSLHPEVEQVIKYSWG
ncbi:MAG TPA: OsmC family protein [Phnomibacter sp.]|nr:OsmC family protein [Phnomibacter sp.]